MEKKNTWLLKLNFVSPIIRPVEETQGGFRVRLQVASAFFPQIIGKGGQIKVQSLICTCHHNMDTQGEAAGGLSILLSDHRQRRSDQGTAPLILAIIPWIFRVRLQVASAFFPQIIGKGGQINVQSLILANIFRVRLQVASAFFPKIIGKGGQIKVQLH